MVVRVVVDARGKTDNLGDSMLRRAWLDALRPIGELAALVGEDADYASGLGTTGSDRVFQRWGQWFRSALWSGVRQPTIFALNAGELSVHRQFAGQLIWQTLLAVVVRARGGRVLLVGIGFRGGSTRLARSMLPLVALAQVVSWRDPCTQSLLGTGEVNPDWAFALGQGSLDLTADLTSRQQIAVCMRGDRPAPDAAWISAVRALAEANDCSLVVVTQVGSDQSRAELLAALLSGRLLSWHGGSHREHEIRVREVYAASVAVVSDRLHALILGLTEGASPVGFVTGNPEKVSRGLAAITDRKVGFCQDDLTGPDLASRLQGLVDARLDLVGDLCRGREQLVELSSRIREDADLLHRRSNTMAGSPA